MTVRACVTLDENQAKKATEIIEGKVPGITCVGMSEVVRRGLDLLFIEYKLTDNQVKQGDG